jgi:peptide/nickel transport system permease protein
VSAATPAVGAAGSGSAFERPVERVQYWSIVWAQLAKNRVAVAGMRAVALFVVLAVAAPLLTLDQPFVWRDAEGFRFPWFTALFNRLLFENAVDVFFNLLLVTAPLHIGLYLLVRRRSGSAFNLLRARLLRRQALAHLLLFAAMTVGGRENPLRHTEQVRNWADERVRIEAAGEELPFAIFPLRHFNYRATDPSRSVQEPSLRHWVGTDTEGRDVFARMLYGTRVSLTIGVVAVSIYVTIGVILGALAGFFGGWVDATISRAIEVMICFPSFFLILTLAAFVEERSIFHVMIIIGITSWTGVARLIRAEFLKHKALEYAQAAVALGIPRRRIIFRHILPNAIAPVLVTATFGAASAVLTESGLAFLGLGDLSAPSWGMTLSAGRSEGALWLILAPGFAVFVLVSVLNLVGEGLRDALDPKLRA